MKEHVEIPSRMLPRVRIRDVHLGGHYMWETCCVALNSATTCEEYMMQHPIEFPYMQENKSAL